MTGICNSGHIWCAEGEVQQRKCITRVRIHSKASTRRDSKAKLDEVSIRREESNAGEPVPVNMAPVGEGSIGKAKLENSINSKGPNNVGKPRFINDVPGWEGPK